MRVHDQMERIFARIKHLGATQEFVIRYGNGETV